MEAAGMALACKHQVIVSPNWLNFNYRWIYSQQHNRARWCKLQAQVPNVTPVNLTEKLLKYGNQIDNFTDAQAAVLHGEAVINNDQKRQPPDIFIPSSGARRRKQIFSKRLS